MIYYGEIPMIDAEQGVAIQIGINSIAEYAYLLEPNWKEVMQAIDPLKQVPHQLQTIKRWQFIGIDSDCASTLLMQQKYPSDAVWINAFVTGNKHGICRQLITNVYYELLNMKTPKKLENVSFPGFLIPMKPLDEIIVNLGLTRLDLLALDIEGTEVELMENYSWNLKPAYLSIEFHHNMLDIPQKDFDKIILDQGYTKIFEKETNFDGDGKTHTTELQFLKNDR